MLNLNFTKMSSIFFWLSGLD